MTAHTNPARRLHEILMAVKNYGGPGNVPVTTMWSRILEEESPPRLMKSWLGLTDLLDSWEESINANNSIDRTRYLDLINRIRQALYSINLAGTVQQLKAGITEEMLSNLAFAADATPMDEIVLSDEDVQDLLTEVSELIEHITASDLDKDLQIVLVEGAESMRSALLHYNLLGPEGVREAFYRNVGMRFMHQPDINHTTTGDRIDATLNKIFRIIESSATRQVFKLARVAVGQLAIGADDTGVDTN